MPWHILAQVSLNKGQGRGDSTRQRLKPTGTLFLRRV